MPFDKTERTILITAGVACLVLFILLGGHNTVQQQPSVAPAPAKTQAQLAAENKQFETCKKKLKQAQRLDVLYDMNITVFPPHITVGPTFYTIPIDAKQGFAETVSCFLTAGEAGKLINFDLLDYRTGKHVARFSYGQLKMD